MATFDEVVFNQRINGAQSPKITIIEGMVNFLSLKLFKRNLIPKNAQKTYIIE